MWHAVCPYKTLQDRPEYGFTLEQGWDTKKGLLVQHQGQVYAYENICPHQWVSLNWSEHTFFEPEHVYIQCSMHGALFEPNTGLCVYGPCIKQQLKAMPVRLEQDNVQVWFEFKDCI